MSVKITEFSRSPGGAPCMRVKFSLIDWFVCDLAAVAMHDTFWLIAGEWVNEHGNGAPVCYQHNLHLAWSAYKARSGKS